jgi:exodeoxyribonuclease-3
MLTSHEPVLHKELTLVSWNVNSIRARLPLVMDLIAKMRPELLLLQEIKCQISDFPVEVFETLGYKCIVNGQPQYNGVAILYRSEITAPTEVKFAIPGCTLDEARYLEGVFFDRLRISNLYVPNGSEIGSVSYKNKLHFLSSLYFETQARIADETDWVLMGDFNIVPRNIDTADKSSKWEQTGMACHEIRKFWRRLINQGWTDIGAQDHKMTWEDYRNRAVKLRIDHAVLSPGASDALIKFDVLQDWRDMERPSDHSPLLLTLDLSKPKVMLNRRWWGNPLPDALLGLTDPRVKNSVRVKDSPTTPYG